jgi:hypothetical protein
LFALEIRILPFNLGLLLPAIILSFKTSKFKYRSFPSATSLHNAVTFDAKIVFNFPVNDISLPTTSSFPLSLIYLSAT